MKWMLPIALLMAGTAASAEGFNLTQLMMADFKVVAAVPGGSALPKAGGTRRYDTLYLEGKLPGGTYKIVVRCIVRDNPEEGDSNCWQVY